MFLKFQNLKMWRISDHFPLYSPRYLIIQRTRRFGELKIFVNESFSKYVDVIKRRKNLYRYFFFLSIIVQGMKTYYENMENFNVDDNRGG